MRERKAQRERRELHYALRQGELQRRQPTELELRSFIRAIDSRDMNLFGLRNIVQYELDLLLPMPAMHTRPGSDNAGFERHLTVMSYAAWRRRHGAIKQLLIAGASPTISDRAPRGALCDSPEENEALLNLLTRRHGSGVPSSTACHIVEVVCRMRTAAARDAALGAAAFPPCAVCGAEGTCMSFDPCGCVGCEACVWRQVLVPRHDDVLGEVHGDVTCPACRTICPPRGLGAPTPMPKAEEGAGEEEAAATGDAQAEASKQSGGTSSPQAAASAPAPALDSGAAFKSWKCECCFYSNYNGRFTCRNCNGKRGPAGVPPPPSRYAPPCAAAGGIADKEAAGSTRCERYGAITDGLYEATEEERARLERATLRMLSTVAGATPTRWAAAAAMAARRGGRRGRARGGGGGRRRRRGRRARAMGGARGGLR